MWNWSLFYGSLRYAFDKCLGFCSCTIEDRSRKSIHLLQRELLNFLDLLQYSYSYATSKTKTASIVNLPSVESNTSA
jgi:hypothetical protein